MFTGNCTGMVLQTLWSLEDGGATMAAGERDRGHIAAILQTGSDALSQLRLGWQLVVVPTGDCAETVDGAMRATMAMEITK